MNLFRSEEHITTWLAGRSPGATIAVTQLSQLAHVWWHDRLAPDWRPHTVEDNQTLLEEVGLTGSFWSLT